ncbi:MAG TPA: FAD-dependent oxidoreductase [Bacillales bacterium]|nr:FAD-dependent oxidoreductase [Bacillales bacterium]
MKDLLLVGAGQAHLYVLKQLQKSSLPDVKVTLLSLSEYQYYSGMFPGYAEGLYPLEEIQIDVRHLAEEAGAEWVKGAAVSVDPEQKTVLTDQGKMLGYDVVSFNIGSLTYGTDRPGVLEYAEMIKPNDRFPEVMKEIHKAVRPVIVGGGWVAVELALALQTRRNKEGMEPLMLVSEGSLLDEEIPRAGEKAEALAREKGISLHLHDAAEAVMNNKVVTASNRKIPFDRLLWVAGPRPHQMFSTSLPVDESGYLLVENTLQVKAYPSIFGAGDCVSVRGFPHHDKAAFYAMKQASILWENLKGFFGKGEGQLYQPGAASFLKIMSTGDRKGIMLYKGRMFYGKWSWMLKNRMNRKLIKQFQ